MSGSSHLKPDLSAQKIIPICRFVATRLGSEFARLGLGKTRRENLVAFVSFCHFKWHLSHFVVQFKTVSDGDSDFNLLNVYVPKDLDGAISYIILSFDPKS